MLPKGEYTPTPGPSLGKEFGVLWLKGLDEEWHREPPIDIETTLIEFELTDDEDTESSIDPDEDEDEDFSDLEAEFARADLSQDSGGLSSEDELEYPPEPDEWPRVGKRMLKDPDEMMEIAEVKLGGMETWVNFVWGKTNPPADARFLASFRAWYRSGEEILNQYTPEYLYLFITVESDGSVRNFVRYQNT